VSVVIDDPVMADALSTAMFVLGEKEAISLAKKLNAEYIIVKEENNKIKVITSQKIKKYISEKYF
jgi:thiamine biosynthesis lipoprotein ApbE